MNPDAKPKSAPRSEARKDAKSRQPLEAIRCPIEKGIYAAHARNGIASWASLDRRMDELFPPARTTPRSNDPSLPPPQGKGVTDLLCPPPDSGSISLLGNEYLAKNEKIV
ncbi:hypothetical protein AVEN_163700-1 [Araneus ventricosus]|uniref:Uncharacterized protein n=1 Tax=Araneus ventricosus TaxID=182803 RepID=A0A4Y2NTE4_ARAVE|nr:hypothetical protein AVEN_163700-1 [Araneus ventricosus]